MVAAMAVGVAVGMRSPLVAVFLIPELLGDYRLVLPLVVVVAVVGVAAVPLLVEGARNFRLAAGACGGVLLFLGAAMAVVGGFIGAFLGALLLIVATLACVVPALRATRVNPIIPLRAE